MASDMDIIDAMRTRKMNPKLYSLEQIMSDVPMLNYENPLLYSLYLHHNPLTSGARSRCGARPGSSGSPPA